MQSNDFYPEQSDLALERKLEEKYGLYYAKEKASKFFKNVSAYKKNVSAFSPTRRNVFSTDLKHNSRSVAHLNFFNIYKRQLPPVLYSPLKPLLYQEKGNAEFLPFLKQSLPEQPCRPCVQLIQEIRLLREGQ